MKTQSSEKGNKNMKTGALGVVVLIGMTLLCGHALAKPERIRLKDLKTQEGQERSKRKLESINLKNIEDPEARGAITEIMNYLHLRKRENGGVASPASTITSQSSVGRTEEGGLL